MVLELPSHEIHLRIASVYLTLTLVSSMGPGTCLIISAIMLLEVILVNFLSYAQLQFYPGLLSSATVAQAPGYPPLDAGFLVTIWIVAVVPAVVLLSGISFFLGTIFPQRSNTIKAIILVAWVLFLL